ncbi:MAG: reverse gyrase [Desulfurococcales archaeon]|nr:reverse gyrase [Desulfurococcales archaeon]
MRSIETLGIGRGIYRSSCPNCGRPNSEERLRVGLPCWRCLPDKESARIRALVKSDTGLVNVGYDVIAESLRKAGSLKLYGHVDRLESEARSLISFFEKLVRSKPWGAQRAWARRLVRGDSFSIIAPTGTGKTTFGLVSSIYLACRGEKAYLIASTTTIVVQMAEKARSLASKALDCSPRIVAFHSKMKRAERLEALKAIESGDFDILISTAAFARKHVGLLSRYGYRLLFVDDVDAVLRSAKSVDTILALAGFSGEDIERGMEYLKLQRELAITYSRISEARERRRSGLVEKLQSRARELEARLRELESKLRSSRRTSVVVSSATGRPRGYRVKLFRALLGFEAGGRGDIGLRNIIDAYARPEGSLEEEAVRLIKKLGGGGLVFVPVDMGIEKAEEVAEIFKRHGIKAEAYHAKKPLSVLLDYMNGSIEVLVGVANYYGLLVRGLDLPDVVKYAIFLGVPRHKFSAEIGEPSPSRLMRLLSVISELPLAGVAGEARRHLSALRRLIRRLSPAAMHLITERVLEGNIDPSNKRDPAYVVFEAYNFVRQALADDEVWEALSRRNDVGFTLEEGKRYMLIADPATYIQASGRTSRLYAGGITRGLSIVLVDDERVFRGLMRRVQWITETKWTPLKELDLGKIARELDEERMRVRELLKEGRVEERDLVKTALLVVESPNKARTIAGFFGQPSIRFLPGGTRVYEVATGDLILLVAASGGHVYDLVQDWSERDFEGLRGLSLEHILFGVGLIYDKHGRRDFIPVYTSIKRCMDCGYQFTHDARSCPICGSRRVKDSRDVIEDLRRLAWETDIVLIGTDPDTEGEKIGWDIALLLAPYARRIARLEFHEVTRKAVMEALKSLRSFDDKLVDAQIVRRIEDRWIGFTLSPLLWCHFWPRYYCSKLLEGEILVRGDFAKKEVERCRSAKYYYNLSAGRVQTPTLGWVIERYAESRSKIRVFRITVKEVDTNIYLREDELGPEKAKKLEEIYKTSKEKPAFIELEIREESREKVRLKPPPPYSTDSMILDASRLLRLGAPETMRLAQDLFEWGLITYHRTDSTRVSDKGIQVARDYLEEKYGDRAKELLKPRHWGEGGAHEAIRPVRPIDASTLQVLVEENSIELPGRLTFNHLRLYDMIFRRFMASQMKEADVTKITYKVKVLVASVDFKVERYEVPTNIVDKGFLEFWAPLAREQLVPIKEGFAEARLNMTKVSRVPPYNEGELIDTMKRKGIGRPSTYAKIVETLLRRRYITRLSVKEGYIVPTLRGEHVYHYLTRYLAEPEEEWIAGIDSKYLLVVPDLVSEERTRKLERAMDDIERGERSRIDVLQEIYDEVKGLSHYISEAGQSITRRGAVSPLAECIAGMKGLLEELPVEARNYTRES